MSICPDFFSFRLLFLEFTLVFSIEKLDVEMPGPFEYLDKIPSAFSSCRLCGYLPPLRRGRQQVVQRAAQQAVEAEAGKNRGTTHPCIQLRGEGGQPIAIPAILRGLNGGLQAVAQPAMQRAPLRAVQC